MTVADLEFCKKAVAYLKPRLSEDTPAINFSEEDTPVLSDLGNGLLISYAVDTGVSFQFVLGRHIANAGLSEEDLRQIGIANLDKLEKASEASVVPYENIFAVLWDGNFEASLLLLDHFWDEYYASLAPNGFAATLPARDVLSFCDANSPEGIQQLKEIAARSDEMDHPIANALYLRKPGSLSWSII